MALIFNPNNKKGVFMIPSGATKSPTPTPPSFTNRYSLNFDGVDDYVNSGASTLSGETALSISAWVYPTAYGDATAPSFVSTDEASPRAFYLGVYTSNNFRFSMSTNGANLNSLDTAINTVDLNVWQHIFITWDKVNTKFYKNGVLLKTVATTFANNQNFTTTNDLLIGARRSSAGFFEGNIDEVAIFNSVVDIADVWNGTGEATDLSAISGLVNWYRNGDNGTWARPQWLIPSNENKDKVSNYSFAFDGVNDYIDCGANPLIGEGTLSISAWFNLADTNWNYILGDNSVRFYINGANGDTRISFRGSTDPFRAVVGAYGVDVWNNLVLTFDGSLAQADRLKLYLNGVALTNINAGTPSTTLLANPSPANFMIGRGGGTTSDTFSGNLDEVALWNTTLTPTNVTDIYNSGVPTTLPSGALSHWKMGENSTFVGGVWAVEDVVGSNDGTSVNMTIEDRVGDAPNSTSNAVSLNMDEVDRETDVPA